MSILESCSVSLFVGKDASEREYKLKWTVNEVAALEGRYMQMCGQPVGLQAILQQHNLGMGMARELLFVGLMDEFGRKKWSPQQAGKMLLLHVKNGGTIFDIINPCLEVLTRYVIGSSQQEDRADPWEMEAEALASEALLEDGEGEGTDLGEPAIPPTTAGAEAGGSQ